MKREEMAIWGCRIPQIGIHKLMFLEREFQSIENIYLASEKELEAVKGISKADAKKIAESRETFESRSFVERMTQAGVQFCTYFDENYPSLCKTLYDPPKILYFRGHLPKEKICVAIVGARNCSFYGKEMARHFAHKLSEAGIGIVSGMARGIDGWGHQGALEGGGNTYAVLGNGVDICYPAEHEKLYQSILVHGGVMSEYLPGTRAAPGFFPQRNRIISGLSQGILVVEARKKSGSLITAEQALEQGKDVFVVPGRVGDALSEGCNNLIKQGAYLVTSAEEIMDFYGVINKERTENEKKIKISLETREEMVYASLSLEPKHLYAIAEELNLESVEVMKAVLSLLKRRLIKETGNHYYIKNLI